MHVVSAYLHSSEYNHEFPPLDLLMLFTGRQSRCVKRILQRVEWLTCDCSKQPSYLDSDDLYDDSP